MSSFSCQFLDKNETFCVRLKTDCVPGRPGCVLKGRFVFAVPASKRIEENKKAKPASNKKDNLKK
jgi:hypothetical protein